MSLFKKKGRYSFDELQRKAIENNPSIRFLEPYRLGKDLYCHIIFHDSAEQVKAQIFPLYNTDFYPIKKNSFDEISVQTLYIASTIYKENQVYLKDKFGEYLPDCYSKL